jgi:FMN phosphatase YigB (HAD superfamily)
MFRLAAERAGRTPPPGRFGDDLGQEIAGAARLGLRSVWLNPDGRPGSADVDLQAGSFPEAVRLLLSATTRAPSPPGPGRPTPPR